MNIYSRIVELLNEGKTQMEVLMIVTREYGVWDEDIAAIKNRINCIDTRRLV